MSTAVVQGMSWRNLSESRNFAIFLEIIVSRNNSMLKILFYRNVSSGVENVSHILDLRIVLTMVMVGVNCLFIVW